MYKKPINYVTGGMQAAYRLCAQAAELCKFYVFHYGIDRSHMLRTFNNQMKFETVHKS